MPAGILVLLCSFETNAQTIPNSGFENWQMAGTVEKPSGGWVISDEMGIQCSPLSSQKSTDKAAGDWALQLRTSNCMGAGGTHEGFAFITFPVNAKPNYLNFKYKSAHAGPDSAYVRVKMTRWNGSKQTLADTYYYIKGNKTSYQTISLPINYTATGTPDTAFIEIGSDGLMGAAQGNRIWVDELSFSNTTTGVETPDNISFLGYSVFPNPAAGKISVNMDLKEANRVTVQLKDLSGKLLIQASEPKQAGFQTINLDINHLAPGLYFYTLIAEDRSQATGKFLKQ